MANEYNGFSGLDISTPTVRQRVVEFQRGFKGISIGTSNKQYVESLIGFKGVSISVQPSGYACKIIHWK